MTPPRRFQYKLVNLQQSATHDYQQLLTEVEARLDSFAGDGWRVVELLDHNGQPWQALLERPIDHGPEEGDRC